MLLISFTYTLFREQQFVYLAYSFLKGSLSFVILPPTTQDLSYFNSRYFWPLGPFPAVLLLPFIAVFKTSFHQSFIQFPLTILNAYLVYKISKILGLNEKKSIITSSFFIFGSIYTPVAFISFSWYFAQVIAATLILLAIYEQLNRNRPFLIGSLIALATLTRLNLIFSLPFFLLPIINTANKRVRFLLIILPVAAALILTSVYNYLRFGNIFESGYKYQIIPTESQIRRDAGIISLVHIPANLFYMLLKSPDPVFKDSSHILKFPYIKFDYYGVGIFYMSPVLLLIFYSNFKEKLTKNAAITTIFLMIPVLTYYGIGYRYALDFLPFLLFPLVSAIKKTSAKFTLFLTLIGIIITWLFIFERLRGF